MAYREYKWMTLDDANRAEPAAAEQAVSEVARGIVPSTVTDHGFMEVYRMVDGDPEEMHNVMATDNSTWAERRYQFVARHLAQGKEHKRKTGNNPWWRDGEPTRRHLGLMMWAYTPTPSQTARWLDSQDRKQNPMAPGYQSWKWIQEDWRTVIPHRDDTVDYSHKCGEGSLKTKSGRPYLCLPIAVIRSLQRSEQGRQVLISQARKKIMGRGTKKVVPWHPLIKEKWRKLQADTQDDFDDPSLRTRP